MKLITIAISDERYDQLVESGDIITQASGRVLIRANHEQDIFVQVYNNITDEEVSIVYDMSDHDDNEYEEEDEDDDDYPSGGTEDE